jgi:hypothetical protein
MTEAARTRQIAQPCGEDVASTIQPGLRRLAASSLD